MKNTRLKKYIQKKQPNPIKEKEDVARNPDNKIDQDFPGFPHGQSTEKIINPKTRTEKKIAGIK